MWTWEGPQSQMVAGQWAFCARESEEGGLGSGGGSLEGPERRGGGVQAQ